MTSNIQTTVQQDARRFLLLESEGFDLGTNMLDELIRTDNQADGVVVVRRLFENISDYYGEDGFSAVLDGVSASLVAVLQLSMTKLRRFTNL